MSRESIDAKMFRQMFLAGAADLKANKEWINELNVFPVPDGDTGTNMTMTITSAVHEVGDLSDDYDMKTLCKAISSGSLRGARGNSGVILSQLLRGFCKTVRESAEITVPLAADGCERAVDTAYKAVMKPKEGTILTVAKGMAVKARELADAGETDLDKFIEEVTQYGDEVLAKTPELLPVLKQAGVVDSGGQGLMQVIKGCLDGLRGKTVTPEDVLQEEEAAESESEAAVEAEIDESIRFGYGTDFQIVLDRATSLWNPKTERDFENFLKSIGDTVTSVLEGNAVTVHLNTNDPGLAVEKALMYGQLRDIRIRNLRLEKKIAGKPEGGKAAEAEEKEQPAPAEPVAEEMPHKDVGFIAVCAGSGLEEIFRGLGVDYVVSGGQTMNPSTDDVLKAVGKVNADTVFVLPNNKNIIMAANQAAALTEDKQVVVIPTKTVPQGITAVINFMPDADVETNRDNMTQEIARVESAEVTYAVRDTMIDDTIIHQGDMMGLGDKGILAVGSDRDDTTIETLRKMVKDTTSLVSIYYGSDVTEADAEKLLTKAKEAFPTCDVELQAGGQPIYYYILSAEE